MISAKVIADSRNPQGDRITTMVLNFPRIVLAEFNTHRRFSRNSGSSRAIPFKKMLELVQENPFIPIAWQKDHKGMQGTEYITNEREITYLENSWLQGRDRAVSTSHELNGRGATKQLCNRLLEPFMYHKVIVTATEWENFFALRCPQYTISLSEDISDRGSNWQDHTFRSKKDLKMAVYSDDIDNYTPIEWLEINKSEAEIHIQAVAEAMWDARNESTPKELKSGEWHIPFGDGIHATASLVKLMGNNLANRSDMDAVRIKIATARCARISYNNFEGKDDYEADLKLYERLSTSGHWSPFEHCAKVMTGNEYNDNIRGGAYVATDTDGSKFVESHNDNLRWSGNFRGFIQLRKTFKGENITL